MICYILGMGKQHLGPHVVVGYGIKIFVPRPLHYVTRSPGRKCMATPVALAEICFFCRVLTWHRNLYLVATVLKKFSPDIFREAKITKNLAVTCISLWLSIENAIKIQDKNRSVRETFLPILQFNCNNGSSISWGLGFESTHHISKDLVITNNSWNRHFHTYTEIDEDTYINNNKLRLQI